jgi:hypothetical protein
MDANTRTIAELSRHVTSIPMNASQRNLAMKTRIVLMMAIPAPVSYAL